MNVCAACQGAIPVHMPFEIVAGSAMHFGCYGSQVPVVKKED